jgi:molybdate transport system substrate-binding protein
MRVPCGLFVALFAAAGHAQAPVIAAAANVKYALDEIAERFQGDTGHALRITYGSTGNFAQQIANGAPFQLFLAADEATVDRLADAGLTRDRGAVYATGRLVLFVPKGSPLKADAGLADLGAAVRDGRVRRFAIANPEHAPYGRAAQQALERAGVWEAIRPRLVLGESVSQAMQFAASADAQGGLVPLALTTTPQVAAAGTAVLLPESMHDPLRQRMALLKPAGPVAERFYAYLQGPASRAILVRHGYAVPGHTR